MLSIPYLFQPPFFRESEQLFQALESPFTSKNFMNQRSSMPRVDMSETDTEFIIEVEVPGMKKHEILLEFTGKNTLTIRGHSEKKNSDKSTRSIEDASSKTKDKNVLKKSPQVTYLCQERVLTEFTRSISLPPDIDKDHTKASMEDGLLRIEIPKFTTSATKRITID
ncbi:hypothetical protein PCANB_001071 [Pneumocystis canis]|nr:hypothetical protein PCK1_001071 [Pneumocystis canis]KAG5437278.1 hypothetical protein PCANB_001071 [Pneumocystis canis]